MLVAYDDLYSIEFMRQKLRQRYGGGESSEENQMPVEECGNLLAIFGALAKMEGNADFAAIYWDQLSQWADYLQDKGFDPENQLCTDDFAGHMAHNVNLSAKAICGLGAYAMLCDSSLWSKYASRDKTQAKGWAPMPQSPKTKSLAGTSDNSKTSYRYTTQHPDGDWYAIDYSDARWKQGPGGLGTPETPNTSVATRWDNADIWIRRTVKLAQPLPNRIGLRIYHDEDAQVYLNGKLVAELGGYTTDYELVEISASAIREGINVIAIHCHQTRGGQFIDCGLDAIIPVQASS